MRSGAGRFDTQNDDTDRNEPPAGSSRRFPAGGLVLLAALTAVFGYGIYLKATGNGAPPSGGASPATSAAAGVAGGASRGPARSSARATGSSSSDRASPDLRTDALSGARTYGETPSEVPLIPETSGTTNPSQSPAGADPVARGPGVSTQTPSTQTPSTDGSPEPPGPLVAEAARLAVPALDGAAAPPNALTPGATHTARALRPPDPDRQPAAEPALAGTNSTGLGAGKGAAAPDPGSVSSRRPPARPETAAPETAAPGTAASGRAPAPAATTAARAAEHRPAQGASAGSAQPPEKTLPAVVPDQTPHSRTRTVPGSSPPAAGTPLPSETGTAPGSAGVPRGTAPAQAEGKARELFRSKRYVEAARAWSEWARTAPPGSWTVQIAAVSLERPDIARALTAFEGRPEVFLLPPGPVQKTLSPVCFGVYPSLEEARKAAATAHITLPGSKGKPFPRPL